MQTEDIGRITQFVGYGLFLVVFFCWKPVGRYLLKKHPDNIFVTLFYIKFIKIGWKMIFVLVGAIIFVPLIIIGLSTPFALLSSVAVSIYSVGSLASTLKKNVWEYDQKPTLEDEI